MTAHHNGGKLTRTLHEYYRPLLRLEKIGGCSLSQYHISTQAPTHLLFEGEGPHARPQYCIQDWEKNI
jgi:hypothetical protein